jgi:hypothetical protein
VGRLAAIIAVVATWIGGKRREKIRGGGSGWAALHGHGARGRAWQRPGAGGGELQLVGGTAHVAVPGCHAGGEVRGASRWVAQGSRAWLQWARAG